MKKTAILCAGIMMLSAGMALAALGPERGLPQGWTMTAGQGYGAVALVNSNPGSAMCVECHAVNPSRRILDVEENAAKYDVDPAAAKDQGSHFVINDIASAAAGAPWGITNTGGGFAGGIEGARNTGEYEKTDGWAGAGAGAGLSKYGNKATAALTSITGTPGDMICESCHNIILNTANTEPDNDLLLGTYLNQVDDQICLDCHGAGSLAGFHGNGNLKNFGQPAARKRHHVNTTDTILDGDYPADGVSGTRWAPSFSLRLGDGWCATAYGARGAATELASPVTPTYRGACNIAGSGTKTLGNVLGDIEPPDATEINCSSCHRPHNAYANSGGFILRMGDGTKGNFEGAVGPNVDGGIPGRPFSGLTDANIAFGLRRQSDVDPSYGTKVYTEYRPICAGCHEGY